MRMTKCAIALVLLVTFPVGAGAQSLPTPTLLSLTPGSTTMTLGFTAAAQGSVTQVGRNLDGSVNYTIVAAGVSGTSYQDTGTANGTRYYYAVRNAVVAQGLYSAWSNQMNGVPSGGGVPGVPTITKAVVSSEQVVLTWSKQSVATSYNVYRSTVSGAEALIKSGVTGITYIDTGLTNSTTYYYKMASVSPSGASPLSAEVSLSPVADNSQGPSMSLVDGLMLEVTRSLIVALGGGLIIGWIYRWRA